MPRPRKGRRVCSLPRCTDFGPVHLGPSPPIIMTIDEYEVLRLMDLEDMTQEDCAAQIGVARTTVQAIYAAARRKTAQCLVQGRLLRIEGGEIRLSEHQARPCGRGCCHCPLREAEDGEKGREE